VSDGCRAIFVLSWSSVSRSKGRPGLLANASCLAENGTGLGGAATFLTTCCDTVFPGGTEVEAPAVVPKTLVLDGAIGGATAIEVSLNSFAGTGTPAFATGSELASTVPGTAVTAPGIFWFAYLICRLLWFPLILVLLSVTFVVVLFVMLVLLLVTVVVVFFVIVVLLLFMFVVL
jgi:hypothetical protein